MLFQTTAAHEELRAKIRSFAEEEIKPLAFLMDQNNEFPEEAVKKLGKLGWMGIPYPKEYGGAGLDALSYAIAVEELARVDGGTGVILSAHVSLGSWPIFAYGTEEQKKKYLVPLAKGENSDFKSFCVAYMVSTRYGVDTRGFSFDRLPREFSEMDTQVFKGELGSMRDVLGEIQSDMFKSLEKNKPPKNKEQER